MKFRFSTRDIVWLTVVVAILLVWWLDHRNLVTRNRFTVETIQESPLQKLDLDFGKRQVEQVISDRPEMGEIFKKVPEMRKIAELRFAGEGNGSRVYWDNREPVGEQPAEHMTSTPDYPSVVRVSSKINATEAFTCLLFELNNFMIDREYDKLRELSPNQRTTREAFAESCVRCEFEAMLDTKALF